MAMAAALVAVGLFFYGPPVLGEIQARFLPDRVALRTALAQPEMAELRAAYAERDYKPIWISGGKARPEAAAIVRILETSDLDGLNPQSYQGPLLARDLAKLQGAARADRAGLESRLTRAYVAYVADLHRPSAEADMLYTDEALQPNRPSRAQAAHQLATSRGLPEAIRQGTRMNPLYLQYRHALQERRASGPVDPETEKLLLINLDRTRALPVDLGPRFVLVDTASSELTMYENGRPVDGMKVVVGAPHEQTPPIAGLIRYAVFNPSWNVPPDLTRDSFAPRIRAHRGVLDALQMDVWSDYTAKARKLDPADIDWGSVARGERAVWLRQRPGPQNAMGAVKFMLPNELGIYLHDTPNRALFARAQRAYSAGCVRVEDYRRLAQWLYAKPNVGPATADHDQRMDLPTPIPVYLTYLTLAPRDGGVVVRPDVYGRDPLLWAKISARDAGNAPPRIAGAAKLDHNPAEPVA